MKYLEIAGVKHPVSRIVSGTDQYSGWMEDKPLFDVLDAARELGINTIDSGREYAEGACERAIGRWLAKNNCREEMVLISKGAHHNEFRKRVTPYDITADLMDSLTFYGTDYIDIYLLHRDDESKDVGPIMECLHEHRAAGRISVYGASNWSVARIKEANAYAKAHGLHPFEIISPHFSLGVQVGDPHGGGCISLTGEDMAADRQWFADNGFSVFAYSSLCMGVFAGFVNRSNYKELYEQGKLPEPAFRTYCSDENFGRLERAEQMAKEKGVTVAMIALAYVINYQTYYGLNTFALAGAANREQVESGAAAADLELTKAEVDWLYSGK